MTPAPAPDSAKKKKRTPKKPKTPIKYPASYPPGTLVKKSFYDDKLDKKRLFKGSVRNQDEKSRKYKIVYEDGDSEMLRKKEVDKILDVKCLGFLGAKFLGGTRVAKLFPDPKNDGKERLFKGKVTKYDHKLKLYKITYDDGDKEDMTEAEVVESLVDKGNKYPINAKLAKEFFDSKLNEKRPFEGKVEDYDAKSKLYQVVYEDGDGEELNEKELGEIVVKTEDGKIEKVKKSWKPKAGTKKKHHKFGYDSDSEDSDYGPSKSRKKQKSDAATATPKTPSGKAGRLASLSPSGRSPRSTRKVVKYADEADARIDRDHPEDFVPEKKKTPEKKKKKKKKTPTKEKKSPAKRKKSPTKGEKSPAKKKRKKSSAEGEKSPAKKKRKKSSAEGEKSPAKEKKSKAKGEKTPAKEKKSQAKAKKSPAEGKKSQAKAEKSPAKAKKSPAKGKKSPAKGKKSPVKKKANAKHKSPTRKTPSKSKSPKKSPGKKSSEKKSSAKKKV